MPETATERPIKIFFSRFEPPRPARRYARMISIHAATLDAGRWLVCRWTNVAGRWEQDGRPFIVENAREAIAQVPSHYDEVDVPADFAARAWAVYA